MQKTPSAKVAIGIMDSAGYTSLHRRHCLLTFGSTLRQVFFFFFFFLIFWFSNGQNLVSFCYMCASFRTCVTVSVCVFVCLFTDWSTTHAPWSHLPGHSNWGWKCHLTLRSVAWPLLIKHCWWLLYVMGFGSYLTGLNFLK